MLPLFAAAAIVSYGITVVESLARRKETMAEGEADIKIPQQLQWLFMLLIGNTVSLGIVILWLLIVTNKITTWEEDMEGDEA